MLLPDNIHPEKTLVYNGALILKALKEVEEVALLDLYLELRKESSLGMPLFVLSLDWLYLANLIEINNQGKVALCS
jgi:hypothetical protein